MEEVFGITPDHLTDDRLARALDAITPKPEVIAGTADARAITEFWIDVSRLRWDMTSMSVHGAFPAEDQDGRYRSSPAMSTAEESRPARARE